MFFDNNRPLLTIDLNALKQNYFNACQYLASGSINCAAVVKANAYGLGAKEVVEALLSTSCRDFYFTYTSEIPDLAQGLNIYILAPQTESEMGASMKCGYVSVLSSLAEIEQFKAVSSNLGLNAPCVINIDTGMNRLGLSAGEITPDIICGLNIKYFMSHLACADEKNHSMNQHQLNQIDGLKKLYPNIKFSLSNSSGLLLGPNYHFDQIRIGAMLYGINPQPDAKSVALPVATIMAKVVGKKTSVQATSVSYGATVSCSSGTKILTLAIGYADGYPKALSNKGYCYALGKKLRVLGRVTMDFIMVDATPLADQQIEMLEYVEVMGANVTIDQLAHEAGTIGYEMLTMLQDRFNRIYL